MYHGATISQQELAQLRKIKHVIRQGRVTHLAKNTITLEKGEQHVPSNSLFIDCSASALGELAPLPVFAEDKITLQTIRINQRLRSNVPKAIENLMRLISTINTPEKEKVHA